MVWSILSLSHVAFCLSACRVCVRTDVWDRTRARSRATAVRDRIVDLDENRESQSRMDGVLAAAGDNARAPLSGARAYEHLFAYGYTG